MSKIKIILLAFSIFFLHACNEAETPDETLPETFNYILSTQNIETFLDLSLSKDMTSVGYTLYLNGFMHEDLINAQNDDMQFSIDIEVVRIFEDEAIHHMHRAIMQITSDFTYQFRVTNLENLEDLIILNYEIFDVSGNLTLSSPVTVIDQTYPIILNTFDEDVYFGNIVIDNPLENQTNYINLMSSIGMAKDAPTFDYRLKLAATILLLLDDTPIYIEVDQEEHYVINTPPNQRFYGYTKGGLNHYIYLEENTYVEYTYQTSPSIDDRPLVTRTETSKTVFDEIMVLTDSYKAEIFDLLNQINHQKMLIEVIPKGFRITGLLKDFSDTEDYDILMDLGARSNTQMIIDVTWEAFTFKVDMYTSLSFEDDDFDEMIVSMQYEIGYGGFAMPDFKSGPYIMLAPSKIEDVAYISDLSNDTYHIEKPNPHYYLAHFTKGQYELNSYGYPLHITLYDELFNEVNQPFHQSNQLGQFQNMFFIETPGLYLVKVESDASLPAEGFYKFNIKLLDVWMRFFEPGTIIQEGVVAIEYMQGKSVLKYVFIAPSDGQLRFDAHHTTTLQVIYHAYDQETPYLNIQDMYQLNGSFIPVKAGENIFYVTALISQYDTPLVTFIPSN